jgi:hypothetical protein
MIGDDCDCEPTTGWPGFEDNEGPTHYVRTCHHCGFQWGSGHCPHDRVQHPCYECGWIDPGARTPMQRLGFTDTPPAS